MIGTRIAQYELVGTLGEGGMGVVYRAIDTRLGRPVAVKVVSERMMRDADGHARLMREARMAAALNHPNVCTIHDVLDLAPAPGAEPDGPRAAIVFELVEGQTLAARTAASGGLPVTVLLDVAVQIADGLAAAHSRRIVHRDLKPQNVIVTAEGRVKILDFGLARLSATAAPDPDLSTRTDFDLSRRAGSEGATRGTVPYMSPEQAAGKPLDHRSDLFSFGIVLYEMATGERPFRGDTAVEILSKVLEAEAPRVADRRADLPVAFGRLVQRCLQKRPEDRYQDTRDVLTELRTLQDLLRSGDGAHASPETVALRRPPTPATSDVRRGYAKWLTAIGIAAAATAIGVLSVLLSQRGSTPPPGVASHRQLTFVGDASLPAISPDGGFIAYVRGEPWGDAFALTVGPRAPQRLIIRDLAGGPELHIGECQPCSAPAWSPDSRSVLFATDNGLALVPRLGGAPRQFAVRGQPSWRPDGNAFAYSTIGSKAIGVVDLTSPTPAPDVPLTWPFVWLRGVEWGPRDRFAVLTSDANEHYEIRVVSRDGTQQDRIVEERRPVRSVQWAPDGETLYYARGGETDELVAVRISPPTGRAVGEPEVIVAGVSMGPHFSIAKDGRSLYYTRELRYANLWSAPLKTEAGRSAKQLTTGSMVDQAPSVSPDGATVAFVRIAGGSSNVFTMPIEGGPAQQLSFMAATNGAPAWSADGAALAFCAASKTEHVVWTFDPVKGTARAFEGAKCPNTGAETPVVWAPRHEILYQRPGNRNYHVLDPDTGREVPLVAEEPESWLFAPLTAPDRTAVAIYWNRRSPPTAERRPGIWLLSASGAEPVRLFAGFAWPLRWSPDGRTVFAYVPERAEIVAIPRAGGDARVLTVLNATRIALAPALTPDLRQVIYSAHAIHADVWSVEHFDPRRPR